MPDSINWDAILSDDQPSNSINWDEILSDEPTTGRPIASLNGSVPPAPGFGDSVRIGIDQAAGIPSEAVSAIRQPLVTGLAGAAGTALGLMSPVPYGAAMGGVAGGLVGDAVNNYIDAKPFSDAFTPEHIARGLVYGTMRGRLVPDAIKTGFGNAAIDLAVGETPSLNRTLAQTAPSAIVPAWRALKGIGGLANTAATQGTAAARDRFFVTGRTPAQQLNVDAAPELFPTRPTINVRTPQDFLDEASITSAPVDIEPAIAEPKDTLAHAYLLTTRMVGEETRGPVAYLTNRKNPVSQEAGARLRLLADANRELSITGKQISAEVMDRLTPAEQDQLGRYVNWRDMHDKFDPAVVQAGQLQDAGDPSLASFVASLNPDQQLQWGDYEQYYPLETATPANVKAAHTEIQDRLLSKFNHFNLTANVKTWDPVSKQVHDYASSGPEYFPRIARDVRPTEDPLRTAIERGDLTPKEAAARSFAGGGPPTTEVGRQTWLFTPDRFEAHPQRTLDKYVDETSKRLAMTIAFGPPEGGSLEGYGSELTRIQGELIRTGRRFDLALLLKAVNDIYTPNHSENAFIGALKRGMANVYLGKSALSQIPQAANNLAIAGVGNTFKGALRRGVESRKFSLAAANDPAMRAYYEEAGQLGANSIPARMTGAVETRWNRSNSAVGYGPHLRSLGQESLAYAQDNLPFPDRLVTEADFYGTTPDVLAKQTKAYGEPSWVRPMRKAIDNAQFHAEVGDVPRAMRTGPAALLGTYKAFPYKQAGFFKDQIAKPLASGDMEQVDMGLERGARLLAGLVTMGVPMRLAKDLIAGREMSDPQHLAVGALEDAVGLYAAPGMFVANTIAGQVMNGRDAERSMVPPIVSLGANMAREAVTGDMPELLMRYLIPMLNPSGTGLEGLALPALHGAMKEPRR